MFVRSFNPAQWGTRKFVGIVISATTSDRVSLGNVTASAVPDRAQEDPSPDEGTKPSPAVDENKLDWKSTMSSTTKLLHGVRDSANGFGPLKSVAGGLCLILENCEVWPLSCAFNPQCL